MIHDKIDDEPALARPADDGNPHDGGDGEGGGSGPTVDVAETTAGDTGDENDGPGPDGDADGNPGPLYADLSPGDALMAQIAAAGPQGPTMLAELIGFLTDIGCHAVANLHPESTRDVPGGALARAAAFLPLFHHDRNRAGEVAQVWTERAAEVERYRIRRLTLGAEPPVPKTPFPTPIAAAYSQKIHGSPGVFEGADVGVDADGQPVVRPRKPAKRRAARKRPATDRVRRAPVKAKKTKPAAKKAPAKKGARGR